MRHRTSSGLGRQVVGRQLRPRSEGQGRVFVISSPSGGGKTTVAARLQRRMPRLARSVSVTTRRPRAGERNGRDYHFLTRAAFERLRRTGGLLEWARVHGACYGTPKGPVLRTLARGRHVLLNIDVQGARQIRQALGRQAVLIFLLPPSLDALRERLVARRTETAATLRRRLAAARRELACAKWYDYCVVNDRLNRTVATLAALVSAPRRPVVRSRKGL